MLQAQWLKITENVSFINASKASYIYIMNGQKFVKKGQFGDFLKTWNWKSQVRHFG